MERNGKASKQDDSWKGIKLTDELPRRAASLIPQKDKELPFLSFSFRYFTQQEYFGIAKQDATWFANLQERLKDLSGKTSAILEDRKEREAYRLHPIDWTSKGCPITKDDLKSVPKNIIDKAEDDFFWQFQLSKGTGRVVGFFNENLTIFYIVILDPKHNIQPSKNYGYQVDDTDIALTDYERIQFSLAHAEKQRMSCRHISDCPLENVRGEYLRAGVFYACLDLELKEKYRELIENGTFQKRLDAFLEKEYFQEGE